MIRVGRVRALVASVAVLSAFGAGCSDETMDKAGDTARSAADDAKQGADKVGARAAAEDLRARIKANDTANAEGARSVKAINESVADVLGSPDITGVADTDGDGLDDDGKVQVEVGGQTACVTLPETGEDTTVTSGDC